MAISRSTGSERAVDGGSGLPSARYVDMRAMGEQTATRVRVVCPWLLTDRNWPAWDNGHLGASWSDLVIEWLLIVRDAGCPPPVLACVCCFGMAAWLSGS